MTPRPKLHIVREPEEELARLFAEEAAAVRHLATIRAAQVEQRRIYADKHSLLMLPPLARLRSMFDAK